MKLHQNHHRLLSACLDNHHLIISFIQITHLCLTIVIQSFIIRYFIMF